VALKIVGAQVLVCSPGRNFVTLKIETDDDIFGLGDASLNGRELAVASYLSEHLVPCLIGRDPSQIHFGIQEYMQHSKETDERVSACLLFDDGYLQPGDMPGLGVDYDEKLAAKFPYERAYLPVNRKSDGTMWNW
jgi:L-alanine-DL-glutamate epimerase-like enolase superfamily enzyme